MNSVILVSRDCGLLVFVFRFSRRKKKEIISFTRPDKRETYLCITYGYVGEVVAPSLASKMLRYDLFLTLAAIL